jgi:hypothetical protein
VEMASRIFLYDGKIFFLHQKEVIGCKRHWNIKAVNLKYTCTAKNYIVIHRVSFSDYQAL